MLILFLLLMPHSPHHLYQHQMKLLFFSFSLSGVANEGCRVNISSWRTRRRELRVGGNNRLIINVHFRIHAKYHRFDPSSVSH